LTLPGVERSGRGHKRATAAAQKVLEQNAQAAGQAQTDQYKKAFSACMEGKGYSVK